MHRIILTTLAALFVVTAAARGDDIDKAPAVGDHWAFRAPQQPPLPAVMNPQWPRNGIDHFVLARIEAAGLQPSPSADRYTLIRRLSLDLTGLPPTPAETDAFVADESPRAYENLVDRLLGSPHFGERWAQMWLDLARYADTMGYEKDLRRDIWRYRDWVIMALNADMPFDRFTIEQLAGDMLPNASLSQYVATAFHRNTLTNQEGGTDDEEFRVAAVKDRVDTTMQVWMGLTVGCAKCHSHKYDPISMRDYYSLYAVFNQTADADRGDDEPRVVSATPEQSRREQELIASIADIERRRDGLLATPAFVEARKPWEQELAASERMWRTLRFESAQSAEGATLASHGDGVVLVSGKLPERDLYTLIAPVPAAGRITALRLEALTDPSLPKEGPGRSTNPNFVINDLTLNVQRASGGGDQKASLKNARATHSQGKWEVSGAVDTDEKTGWGIAPKVGESHAALFELEEPVTLAADDRLMLTISQQFGKSLVLGSFRVSVSSTDAVEKLTLGVGLEPGAVAAIAPADRSATQQRNLDLIFAGAYSATAGLSRDLTKAQEKLTAVRNEIPKIPVMRELPPDKRRESHLHTRGNFLDPGEAVAAALPASFVTATREPPTRLTLAQWLTRRDNPLTARVAVNRLWARLFGTGLVETEEDFGTQGIPPSHPQLLDYLAVEFMENGWSVKQLLKTIVMSATYQQSSAMTSQMLEADPGNRLLARGPRFRLDAEFVRDQALAAAGLLSPKLGGPSVMPHQPEGIWQVVYGGEKWKMSAGEDRYRRGLYTFIRRTSPYPSMLTFDGTSREVCTIRRVRTNTPLQALVTLNDPVYVEAAAALARRMITAPAPGGAPPGGGGASVEERAAHGFRLAVIRPAEAKERRRLAELYESALAHFNADAEAAKQMVQPCGDLPEGVTAPQFAAWISVANVLLNLDEMLTKG